MPFRLFPQVSNTCTIISLTLLYNLDTVRLKWACSCVDFMNVIMGDIPSCHAWWTCGFGSSSGVGTEGVQQLTLFSIVLAMAI